MQIFIFKLTVETCWIYRLFAEGVSGSLKGVGEGVSGSLDTYTPCDADLHLQVDSGDMLDLSTFC